ncbi:DNA polymerase I [Buchnera aphidicola]|uniref:DNA polymerase I n=1 Tax=Buchnera aphidicola TaxID=9 RepID=UPI00094CAF84|nr:DNA polymerase I [Buchnera aphidicola]
MTKKKILLIDGNYCLYQTYFSFINLKNQLNEPTGVLYGCIEILNQLIKKFNPKKIIMVFDTPTKTLRHQLYEEYKKNRTPMPSGLEEQIIPLKEIIQLLGIPIISLDNVEADDIIGTLSSIFEKKKYYIFIYSADKDMTQLVNKKITIIPGGINKNILNEDDIYQKYEISPQSMADFFGLAGDKCDNIPGVPGIGKKTAIILLKKFTSVKNIYKNLFKISNLPIRNIKNITKNLQKYKKQALLSCQLTKINHSIPLPNLPLILKDCNLQIPLLIKKLQYYQLIKFLKEISNNQFPIINIYHEKKKKKYIEIVDENMLYKLIQIIMKKKIFSIAAHLSDITKSNILSVSISIKSYKVWWYTSKNQDHKDKKITKKLFLKKMKPILENKKYRKIGKNLKNMFHIFKKYNITLDGMYFDTLVIFYFYTMRYEYTEFLSNLMQQYKIREKHILTEKKINTIIQESIVSQKIYKQYKKYMYIQSKKKIFKSIDMPLLLVLSTMEHNGVLIKKKILEKQKKRISNTIKILKKKIYFHAKEKFNINSSKQLQKILFDKHHLPYVKKTKKGSVSTNEHVLTELSNFHKLPKIILQYRMLNKIKNTYLKNLIHCINNQTNRIHTTYHLTSTSTGRLSSTQPNLQNIPIKTKLGKKIRIAFIAKKKWLLLTADYTQIELRVIAHYSQDQALIEDLSQKNDVYCKTASHIFNIHVNNIQPHHRNIAKTINFAILYGISPFGLSQKLNISTAQAKDYIQSYFFRYQKVKKYMNLVYHTAKKKKYIKTLFGRKLHISNITSQNKALRNNAKRFCINAIIQNTAADIIKISMINLHSIFQEKFFNDAKIIMQIHDELVFEIKEDKKEDLIKVIKHSMENSTLLAVPLNIFINIGKNWKEVQPSSLSV